MIEEEKRTNILDTNCDGEVDLSEYLTYVLLEHQAREIMFTMSKPKSYPDSPRDLTSKSLSADFFIFVRNFHQEIIFDEEKVFSLTFFRRFSEPAKNSTKSILITVVTSRSAATVRFVNGLRL